MSAKKAPELPLKTEFTLLVTDEGVTVFPRPAQEGELGNPQCVRVHILQEPSRYRNQDCYVAQMYRENPSPQMKILTSQRFSKKGDPVLRADAFYKILGAVVASALQSSF